MNMNRDNLKKMIDYLQSGALKAQFTMEKFDDGILECIERDNCGSVGCVIGHGPYAGIEKRTEETWTDYSDRVFWSDERHHSQEWDWMFAGAWARVDGSVQGAAARIAYYLDHDFPPPWFQTVSQVSLEDYSNTIAPYQKSSRL